MTPFGTHFGTASTGDDVAKMIISTEDLTVSIITWGAAVQDVRLAGIERSLTLGSDNIADYEGDMCHHGTLIGPIANRISTARIKVDGMMYELERNQDDRIHLHSGADATHRRNWIVTDHTATAVTLTCAMMDGDAGLPGARVFSVTYSVDGATLSMTVHAQTDEATPISFANHSYWNLDGTDNWDGHSLQIAADSYLPCTPDCTPTGEVVDVTGTQMDFRAPRTINVADNPFDNNFCLSDHRETLRDVLTLTGASGVELTMATTETGLQVYDGRDAVRPERAAFEGLALEAQMWPDAPTHREFPSIIVPAGETYRHQTTWTFRAP